MAAGIQFDDVSSALFTAMHAMRMELAFCVVLSLLWLTGRISGARLNNVKPPSKKNSDKGTPRPFAKRATAASPSANFTRLRAGTPSSDHKADSTLAPLSAEELGPSVAVASIDKALLCDATWVVPQISLLCRNQVQKALELYQLSMRSGLNLHELPINDCRHLFTALVTSAIRVGQAEEALQLMRDLRKHGPGIPTALFYSATKLCTAKQLFPESLAIYKFVAEDSTLEVDDKSVWSCLLFCAVESKAFDHCNLFWSRLKGCGAPSAKDYGNMARFAAMQGNWQQSLCLVREMQAVGIEIDNVIYNTALATCVGANQADQARALLDEMENVGGVADVITYNTLAKGYAKAGRMEKCFELYELMRKRGIAPSQVTYGILLDGCINENQVDRAAEVADRMEREGCEMNTVLCTTLIKGFARAGQLDRAMKVYEQMRAGRNVTPDLITFSILIKANCDAHRLEDALRLLESMLDIGLRPDEVVFNNLLGGCCKESNSELGKRLYLDMIASGVRPSNATFSILIRLYSQCKLLEEAVEMLRREPAAQQVAPEARLFSQLAQCCLRERQGRRAVEVYKLMLEHAVPTAAVHSSMFGMCVKLNMLDTGAEILALAAEVRGRVDAEDANHLLDAARRKRKSQVVEACLAAMKPLGITPAASH